MRIIPQLQQKSARLVVGLISGTSVDSIDAALIRVRGTGTATRITLLGYESISYPKGFRELVLANSLPGTGSVDLLCRLNVLYAHFLADAVKRVVRKAGRKLSDVDLIGSHGQTVHHLPNPTVLFGKTIRSTLQIGDPSTIAALTGVTTVGDFRMADMAAGGEGAPLAPYLDYLVFRSKTRNRLLLNLGGIANFTVLPKNCAVHDVVAFDTGPANMVIDALMMRFYGKKFDRSGTVARQGIVMPRLLAWMMRHPYLDRRPPKSTGREEFGAMFVRELLKKAGRARKEDVVATATEFTALSVYDQYRRFFSRKLRAHEVLVSGGGSHNRTLMERLQRHFAPARVKTVEDAGFSADAKEAILFAVLANETIAENPSNVPSVTGARRPMILGKICLPSTVSQQS